MRVWEALQRQLPAGWLAWHSLRIQDRDGIDGEGDFVIGIPHRGLLVLEVKGGTVEVRDGRWLQNGREMKTPPRQQALRYVHRLVDRLEQKGVRRPAFGVATFFPQTSFEQGPTQDDVAGRVLDERDLQWLGDALPAVAERALPSEKGGRNRWLEALHTMWGETWTPHLSLGTRIAEAEETRIQLDREQIRLLDMIAANHKVLVRGCAGSGKTILCREAARRLVADDKRVLLLCFTDALAHQLAATAEPGVDVYTVRRLARKLVREAGQDPGSEHDSENWEQLPWRAATDGLRAHDPHWDAVLIDEAQDFTLDEWALAEACAAHASRYWAFCDPAQTFWDDRPSPGDMLDAAQLDLVTNYRCPESLMRAAQALSSDDAGDTERQRALGEAQQAGTLKLVSCPSESSVPSKLRTELDKLTSEGVSTSDIAIISLRGQHAERTLAQHDRLGRHSIVPADDPNMEDHVVADTFLRFKGLERPVVIVTDLHLVRDHQPTRLHIAITRALHTCIVLASKSGLERHGVVL